MLGVRSCRAHLKGLKNQHTVTHESEIMFLIDMSESLALKVSTRISINIVHIIIHHSCTDKGLQ